MNLPAVVRVGYRSYRVETLDPEIVDAAQIVGHHKGQQNVIRVDTRLPGPEVGNTVLHEILHGIWELGDLGDKAKEERAVTVLANGITQVWRDNPDLVKVLSACFKGPTG